MKGDELKTIGSLFKKGSPLAKRVGESIRADVGPGTPQDRAAFKSPLAFSIVRLYMKMEGELCWKVHWASFDGTDPLLAWLSEHGMPPPSTTMESLLTRQQVEDGESPPSVTPFAADSPYLRGRPPECRLSVLRLRIW